MYRDIRQDLKRHKHKSLYSWGLLRLHKAMGCVNLWVETFWGPPRKKALLKTSINIVLILQLFETCCHFTSQIWHFTKWGGRKPDSALLWNNTSHEGYDSPWTWSLNKRRWSAPFITAFSLGCIRGPVLEPERRYPIGLQDMAAIIYLNLRGDVLSDLHQSLCVTFPQEVLYFALNRRGNLAMGIPESHHMRHGRSPHVQIAETLTSLVPHLTFLPSISRTTPSRPETLIFT
jgi:hypothetical protein